MASRNSLLKRLKRFEQAVAAHDVITSRAEFSNLIPLLRTVSPSDQWGARFVSYCAQYAEWDIQCLPLVKIALMRWDGVTDLARRWGGGAGEKISAPDRAYINLAGGIIALLLGKDEESQMLLESAGYFADACQNLECSGAARYFQGRSAFDAGSIDAAIIHTRYGAALLDEAGCRAAAADARIFEAEAQLILGNVVAAQSILVAVLSREDRDKPRRERLQMLIDHSMRLSAREKRFDVALSFPGEVRRSAKAIAEHLGQRFGREHVLYDQFHQAEFARPNLDLYLQRLYHDESTLTVVFLNKAYNEKEWCGLEWRAIRDVLKGRNDDLMLLRLDDTPIPGTFGIDGYIDLRKCTISQATKHILQRWVQRKVSAAAPTGLVPIPPKSAGSGAGRTVFQVS